jgi:hypothetical protein
MRLPFPKSIPLLPLLVVLAVVLCIQLIQGTDPAFALLMLIAQVAAAVAFNHMGGMTHMAGAFCLFAILPTVALPEITHLILGQSGNFNLVHPITTAGVCAAFFICVMIAALFVSWMSHPIPFLDHIQFSIVELRIVSAVSCVSAISIAFSLLTLNEPLKDGSLLAALNHFYPFLLAISVMLATYVEITSTRGQSAMNWYIAFLLVLALVPGIMSASKEGMLMPLLCWFVVVASSRHRFSWFGILGIGVVLFVVWTFVYPFSQNARFSVRAAGTISEKVGLIAEFIRDPSRFPDGTSNSEESSEFGAATSKVSIIARYSVLPSIDMLIDADRKLGYTSIDRYTPVLISFVPHALWPDRPVPITSNELGHKAGFNMAPGDATTGIAIGSPAYFFDLGGWLALIVYTLLCFVFFFFLAIRLVGSSGAGVWGLVLTGIEANQAGNASPATMFSTVVMFLGMFIVTIAVLKIVSYVTQSLISRPIATKA